MVTSTYGKTDATAAVAQLVPKLGAHHLAYLRAIAEGLPARQAAVRYLGQDARDGVVALRQAHNAVVDRVRALARRQGDPRWRLIGLSIKPHEEGEQPPPVYEWAEALGLGDFGQAELLALHAEAFPPDRKALRNGRLRTRQLELLHSLTKAAAETALPHHRLDAWFPAHLCRALQASGLLLLSDLQVKVQAGGRWWTSIPKIGAGKAERLAQHLEVLMPGATQVRRSSALTARGSQLAVSIDRPEASTGRSPSDERRGRPALPSAAAAAESGPAMGMVPGVILGLDAGHVLGTCAGQPADPGTDPPVPSIELGFGLAPEQLALRDLAADMAAVRAWIRARAGSDATAKSYRRELGRFLLFLDRRGMTLSQCQANDCLAYVALLQNVPPDWSTKRTAPLGHEAWSPFAGPLSHRSQRHATVVVSACFTWLVAARYLAGNPWVLVNRSTGVDQQVDDPASRAVLPEHWAVILARLELLANAEPAAERMVFLLQFLEATGLRATELLGARLGDLRRVDGRLFLQVHGKGSKHRVIPVAAQAQRALQRYLESRGLAPDAFNCPPEAPLLCSLVDGGQALTYRSLYGSMKIWLNKAIDGSDLSWAEKVAAVRASPHWLRHTCGARALERGVPLDVVGLLLGHADARTTAKYNRAHIRRVGDELDKAFS